jgi:hypothetical protein
MSVPIEYRELLAEVFLEAERKGLGRFEPGFTATSGREDDAADFIGSRCDHLAELRLGPDDPAAAAAF